MLYHKGSKYENPFILEVAEDLLIKGLSEGNKKFSRKEELPETDYQKTVPSPKRKRTVDNTHDVNFTEPHTKFLQKGDDFIDHENTSSTFQSKIESQTKVAKKEKNEENNFQSLVSVTGDKSFKCDQCDYKATRKQDLKTHIQSVHQKITVSCEKCDKQFSNDPNLRKHNATVHEGVRYKCEHCDYKATQRGHLRQHKSSRHNIE